MENLPLSVQKVLEGGIVRPVQVPAPADRQDPYSQQQVEWYSSIFLVVLTAGAFAASYLTSSVNLGLNIFGVGFVVLLLACVPPWPFLNGHCIKFLPVRKAIAAKS